MSLRYWGRPTREAKSRSVWRLQGLMPAKSLATPQKSQLENLRTGFPEM